MEACVRGVDSALLNDLIKNALQDPIILIIQSTAPGYRRFLGEF